MPDPTGVEIIAPEGFMEHAVTENVIAGNAMSRRAHLSIRRPACTPGPEGQMTSGIGLAVSAGTFTLIPPTRTHRAHRARRSRSTASASSFR